jgi:non-homologous end joining protein Ku
MHQLRYIDEIKPVDEVEGMSGTAASSQPSIDNKELSLGKTLVENLTSKEFDISEYFDEYTKQLEQLINASGKKTFHNSSAENEEDVSKNLLEALKASIQQKAKPKR